VGLIDDLEHVTRATFANADDEIVLLGDCTAELGASEYLARVHGVTAGTPPRCDLDGERVLIEATLECIRAAVVHSAHDCSEGGLAVALAECCIANRKGALGAEVDLSAFEAIPMRALFFGEAQGRIVISTADSSRVLSIAKRQGVPASIIGRVAGAESSLTVKAKNARLSVNLRDMADAYHDAIPKLMSRAPNDGALIEHTTVGSV
jgi:phosphoribosylformylglycinamidine synthase subunit PurL